MAKRSVDVLVSAINMEHGYLTVYADKEHKAAVEAIEGVTGVSLPPLGGKGSWMVWFDRRYSPQEIAREMESLNLCGDVPDVFANEM